MHSMAICSNLYATTCSTRGSILLSRAAHLNVISLGVRSGGRSSRINCFSSVDSKALRSARTTRMRFQLSDKHSLFGRFLRAYQNDISPFEFTPNNILTATNGTFYYADAHTLGSTYLINPTTVNSFRISYSGDNSSRTAQHYAGYKDIG